MKRHRLLPAGFFAVSMFFWVQCNFETASGPTPYAIFKGETGSSSSVEIGTGVKSLVIPALLPFLGAGRTVTITNAENDSMGMKGTIISYNRSSGDLTVQVTGLMGSGTCNDWRVVLGKTEGEVLDSLKWAYVNLKFGMFIHFNMLTFDRCCCPDCYSVMGEWGKPRVDMKQFKPASLNCGQWADVAKSAGCTYMVLVAKHHDGFCNWPTEQTDYCVTNAGIARDIIREFVDSARTRNMKVGLYYSIRDYTNGYKLSFVKGQLTELLSNYGDLVCLWFDGWGWGPGYASVPYDTVRNLIKSIQPHCLIVENNHEFSTEHSEIIEYEVPQDGFPNLGNILPAEGNQPIRADMCWFWHPEDNCDLKPAGTIIDELTMCNSRNAAYLLDLTPDTTGRIPQCQADRMKEVGELLGKRN